MATLIAMRFKEGVMNEHEGKEEKAGLEAGRGALEGSCETPSAGAAEVRRGESAEGSEIDTWHVTKGKRVNYAKKPRAQDTWDELVKDVAPWVKQPTNEVPTRECGWKAIVTGGRDDESL